MKRKTLLKQTLIASLFYCALWNSACVNQIDDEIQEGSVPIAFVTKINRISTKVTNSAFDKGDEAGLFATLTSSDMSQKPYIDNLRLICGDNSTLIPEKAVFYPEGDLALDFISYYPYQPEGKAEGTAMIPVSVEEDQSDAFKYSKSDFLVAKKTGIKSSAKAVELEYQHKLTKIKITLTPGKDEKIEDMLKANPRIVATGLKTHANYNLQEDTFSDLNNEADIVAFGTWSIEEGTLVGKEIIIIPQSTNEVEHSFTMEWNGKLYNCSIPSLNLESSTEYGINISSMQTNSSTFEGIISKISNWKTGTNKSTDNKKEFATIHLAALSFKNSHVYRVYNGGKPVAEICKEHLQSEELTSRAIVVYPVLNNEKTDLSKGTVLQLLDKEEAINGGKISWDINTNSFSYQKGSSAPITQFYLDGENKILLEKTDDIINVNVASYTLRDLRNGQLEEYPIIKIGTQYWMEAELRATAYQTGKELLRQTELGKGAGYFKPTNYDIYFYNGEALLKGKLNPVGWRIPSEEDWKQLENYINNSASLLKAGDWEILSAGAISPVNNLTMFNAYPIGMWFNGKHYAIFKMTAFWSWNNVKQTIPEKTVFFTGEEDKFVSNGTLVTNQTYYKALSIRCIKE